MVNRLKGLANRIKGISQNPAVPDRSVYDTPFITERFRKLQGASLSLCIALSIDRARRLTRSTTITFFCYGTDENSLHILNHGETAL